MCRRMHCERQWKRARIRDIGRKDYAYATLLLAQTINSCASNRSMRATINKNNTHNKKRNSASKSISNQRLKFKQTNKQTERERGTGQTDKGPIIGQTLKRSLLPFWGYAITSSSCQLPMLFCTPCSPRPQMSLTR